MDQMLKALTKSNDYELQTAMNTKALESKTPYSNPYDTDDTVKQFHRIRNVTDLTLDQRHKILHYSQNFHWTWDDLVTPPIPLFWGDKETFYRNRNCSWAPGAIGIGSNIYCLQQDWDYIGNGFNFTLYYDTFECSSYTTLPLTKMSLDGIRLQYVPTVLGTLFNYTGKMWLADECLLAENGYHMLQYYFRPTDILNSTVELTTVNQLIDIVESIYINRFIETDLSFDLSPYNAVILMDPSVLVQWNTWLYHYPNWFDVDLDMCVEAEGLWTWQNDRVIINCKILDFGFPVKFCWQPVEYVYQGMDASGNLYDVTLYMGDLTAKLDSQNSKYSKIRLQPKIVKKVGNIYRNWPDGKELLLIQRYDRMKGRPFPRHLQGNGYLTTVVDSRSNFLKNNCSGYSVWCRSVAATADYHNKGCYEQVETYAGFNYFNGQFNKSDNDSSFLLTTLTDTSCGQDSILDTDFSSMKSVMNGITSFGPSSQIIGAYDSKKMLNCLSNFCLNQIIPGFNLPTTFDELQEALDLDKLVKEIMGENFVEFLEMLQKMYAGFEGIVAEVKGAVTALMSISDELDSYLQKCSNFCLNLENACDIHGWDNEGDGATQVKSPISNDGPTENIVRFGIRSKDYQPQDILRRSWQGYELYDVELYHNRRRKLMKFFKTRERFNNRKFSRKPRKSKLVH